MQYKFKIGQNKEILFNMPAGVFSPTGTTGVLFDAVRSRLSNPGKTLDLGCGCGVLGIALHRMGLVREPLYASDLSQDAVDCAKQNALIHDCPIALKCGSLFEPWENEKFDYIVNDVSGVAVEVAKISPWFKHIPCCSGVDGTELVTQILDKAPAYMNKGGLFFFPVISFSNADKILAAARKSFSVVEELAYQEWPLPKEMYAHLEMLKELQGQGHIQIVEKFGMALYSTKAYMAYNS